MRVTGSTCWVPPFGNPWIIAYLQLPKAYRRLSRPSSAPSAKAFTDMLWGAVSKLRSKDFRMGEPNTFHRVLPMSEYIAH